MAWLKHAKDPVVMDENIQPPEVYVDSDDDFQAKPIQRPKKLKTGNQKPKPVLKKTKLIITSRTHQQITQLVHQLRLTSYSPRIAVLGSRSHLCIHPTVTRIAKKSNSCAYFHRVPKLLAHKSLSTKLWDIEDLVTLGKKVRACPYFTAKNYIDQVDVIFCPYNYVLDPRLRDIMGINVKNAVVVVDEGHNVEDVSRECGSCEVSSTQLNDALEQIKNLLPTPSPDSPHAKVVFVLENLHAFVRDFNGQLMIQDADRKVRLWKGKEVVDELQRVGISKHTFKDVKADVNIVINKLNEMFAKDVVPETESDELISTSDAHVVTVIRGLFMVLGYLFDPEQPCVDDYVMAVIQTPKQGFSLGFWLLNPAVTFRSLSNLARSVIITSGTLSPMLSFSSELDTEFPIQISTKHVIQPSQICVCTVASASSIQLLGTHASSLSYAYQDAIGNVLVDLVSVIPDGVLCFVPSYSLIDNFIKRWKQTAIWSRLESAKKCFVEKDGGIDGYVRYLSGSPPNARDKKASFFSVQKSEKNQNGSVKKGAILFAVYRGKASEGADFPNHLARGVFLIGIPFPNIKDVQCALKRTYNDTQSKLASSAPGHRNVLQSNMWYETQTFRAYNQAIGRCIRHKDDWGVVVMLESRMQKESYRRYLPMWIQQSIIKNEPVEKVVETLKLFVDNRKGDNYFPFLLDL